MVWGVRTKEQVEKALSRPRDKNTLRALIAGYLDSGPAYYTPDAWDYLVSLARQNGIPEPRISFVASRSAPPSQRNQVEKILFVLGLGAAIIIVTPLTLSVHWVLTAFFGLLLTGATILVTLRKNW